MTELYFVRLDNNNEGDEGYKEYKVIGYPEAFKGTRRDIIHWFMVNDLHNKGYDIGRFYEKHEFELLKG